MPSLSTVVVQGGVDKRLFVCLTLIQLETLGFAGRDRESGSALFFPSSHAIQLVLPASWPLDGATWLSAKGSVLLVIYHGASLEGGLVKITIDERKTWRNSREASALASPLQ